MAAIAAPVLAMIGALALACFVKACGAMFRGLSRTDEALAAREAPHAMLLPMGFLAFACIAIGVALVPFSTVFSGFFFQDEPTHLYLNYGRD